MCIESMHDVTDYNAVSRTCVNLVGRKLYSLQRMFLTNVFLCSHKYVSLLLRSITARAQGVRVRIPLEVCVVAIFSVFVFASVGNLRRCRSHIQLVLL
jgi:small basic protein